MAQALDPVPVCPDAPGISKRASPLAVGARWIDSDKILFVDGKPEKFPGWITLTLTSVTDPIRGMLAWSTLQLLQFIGIGTHRKLYVVDAGNDPVDITPVDTTGTLVNPFTVTINSATVIVADTAHGRNAGDEVRFSGATLIATTGMTINGTYQVVTRIDDDSYTITHSVVATNSGTGGGAAVAYVYELPIGTSNPLEGDGYGAGPYGLGDYGSPTDDTGSTIVFEPRVWNLVQAGDLMYANPINGGIYVFDPADTPAYQRAELLTNAPTVCRGLFMTPERFLFALGVDNDTMNIKWPDQDDNTNWTPGSTSTANSRRLREGTRIISGVGLGNNISGVWTDTALYRFQYTGNQFIYNSTLMGTNCGLVSPMALISLLGIAYWMSRHGFFYWGGGVPQRIQNSEDVSEFVIRELRLSGYEYKCNAFYSPRYNVLLWLYVASDETEPGLYVGVSLKDFSWVVGTLERTCGVVGPDQRPILASSDGWLFQHEDGLDDDGEIMQAFIERAPMQIAGGTRLGEITGIVTDMQRQTGTMSIEIKTYDRMNDGVLDTERIAFEPGEDLLDPSIGGRIARLTIRSEALGGDFRIGAPMLEVKATGKIR
jgi:hypothetical protein